MADNFVQDGDVVEVLAGAAVVSGEGHQVGLIFGVCLGAAGSGAAVRLKRKGVFNLPNLTTDVVTVGALLYWNATNGETQLTASTHKLIGMALSAAGNGVTVCEVILTGEAGDA